MSLRIIVVDDEMVSRVTRTRQIAESGNTVVSFEDPYGALEAIEQSPWDVVLTDLRMPGMNGIQFLQEIKRRDPKTSVIVMTAYGSVDTAVDAMKLGAEDFLTKPFTFDELKVRLDKIREVKRIQRENEDLRRTAGAASMFGEMVGQSLSMRRVFDFVDKFAPQSGNVLITGETGTGKELVARALHAKSSVAAGPFVAVACGAVPKDLAESELFGHESGAFTNANRLRRGRIELATGGTLFLDDIDDLANELQPKLLRVIQERKYERVGGERTLNANLRIIAATKADLRSHASKGLFREDLFYRLKVLEVQIPPLRQRMEDIPALVDHFLTAVSKDRCEQVRTLSGDAMKRLCEHDWPGNVRELRHAIEYACAVAKSNVIGIEDLPANFSGVREERIVIFSLNGCSQIDFRAAVSQVENELIQWALKKARGSQVKAAELLGLPRTTLLNKMGGLSEKE